MYDDLISKICEKFIGDLTPTDEDLQFLLFNRVFFTYFDILDGYPDSSNDVLIKKHIITEQPDRWKKVLRVMGYSDIDNGEIVYREVDFMRDLEYYVLQNEFSPIERTAWAHNLLDALTTYIPVNVDDILI